MTEVSFPRVNTPLTDDDWKTVALPMGRGIIDRGGHPYRLASLDSVTDRVTIEVDTRTGVNEAILDGFVHRIDTYKALVLPPVDVETVYEVGLVYDPLKHDDPAGPIGLYGWVAPGDTTGGKSYLTMYRITRKPNVALANSPWTEERPRVCPVFSVSQESQLPKDSLVLVDSLGIARTTNTLHRADIDEAGNITWTELGGSTDTGGLTDSQLQAMKDKLDAATWDSLANTLVQRGSDGIARVKSSNAHVDNILNVGLANDRYAYKAHTHAGDDITSRVPFEHVDGSLAAYQNTNVGSTWASVVATSAGFLGRYPSALKYKQNIRPWNLDADTAYGVTPVKYEDSQNGDTRVGFVADSYVQTIPELVETNPATGEVEGWKYMLTCVLQQVAIRDLNDRVKALEEKLGGSA